MSEDENYESEDFDEEEFNGIDLLDEPPDAINMLIVPNYKVDIEELIEGYIKLAKRCKTKSEISELFANFYNQVYALACADLVYNRVQTDLHNLEELLEVLR